MFLIYKALLIVNVILNCDPCYFILQMVLKQKGKPEKGKKPVRGGPRQFSDHREFPDGPIEEFEDLRVKESDADSEETEDSECSSSEEEIVANKSTAPAINKKPTTTTSTSTNASTPANTSASANAPKEISRREREAIQKEQARQHYLKMKEKEDGARLALVRKERAEAAAKHAEELKAKEAAKRR